MIQKFKTLALGAAIVAFGSMASAATLNGTFTIDLYNFNAGGSSSSADASAANVTAHSGSLVGSTSYTGNLSFGTSGGTTPTIGAFLDSGGGSYSLDAAVKALTLSVGNFTTTTLFDIHGIFASAFAGTITHDDGSSLYDGLGNVIVDSASPTTPIGTAFSAGAGAFRLVYSAANGNPEVLTVDVAAVPLPAGGLLLLGAMGGLAALRRRKSV